jgi:hypothetical protein
MSAIAVLHRPAPPLPDVLDRLGPTWTRVAHVPFGATVDVEHVLLSPDGLAVVTTLATVPPTQVPVAEARWRARKISALLSTVAWVPAQPILVVPGLGEHGYGMCDDVLVARTEDAVSWLAHPTWRTASLTAAQLDAMVDVLTRHTERTERVVRSYRLRAVR